MRNVVLFLTVAVLLVSMAFMTGCGNNGEQNNEEEKYDVMIKVKNSLGDEWIFDLDTKERYVEYEYTGQEIDFYVDSYNLPNHPLWSEKWLSLHGGVNNEFYIIVFIYGL